MLHFPNTRMLQSARDVAEQKYQRTGKTPPKPVIEVHISNISARDEFRSKSVISEVCKGCIFGLGIHGYTLAIDYLNSTYECK